MICPNCNTEISDNYLFCTHCGTKLEKQRDTQATDTPHFCTNCGNPLKPDDAFCETCGAKVKKITTEKTEQKEPPAPQAETKKEPSKPTEEPANPKTESVKPPTESKQESVTSSVGPKQEQPITAAKQPVPKESKSQTWILLTIILVLLLIIAGLLIFKIMNDKTNDKQPDRVTVATEQQDASSEEIPTEETTEEPASTEDPLADVNLDLRNGQTFSLDGLLHSDSENYILQWTEPISIGYTAADGQSGRLDNVTSAIISPEFLPEGLLDTISSNQPITVYGDGLIWNGQLEITVDYIFDANGLDLIKSYELASDEDYIIPDSDKRLLTEDDVRGLTLQEINYAKNEIYARHGRKFDSEELQNYFNSKSWYKGTISPKKFTNGNYLSDIENKNAAFLSEMENQMGGPYQLDQ